MGLDKKTLIIEQQFIASYRLPVFLELTYSNVFDCLFLADEKSPDPLIKNVFTESDLPIEKMKVFKIKLPFLKGSLVFSNSIFKLIKTSPDIYIVQGEVKSISSWVSMALARFKGSVVLTWTHGYLRKENGLKGFIRALYYKIPNGNMLYGNKAKKIMIERGFDPDRLDVIYNSLDYEKQKVLREKLTLEDRNKTRKKIDIPVDAFVMIAIGRLMSKLKLEQAIQAVKLLTNKSIDAYLIIVGDGPEKERLKYLSKECSGMVKFYGPCYDEEKLARLYNASDIAVVMGKVGLSAMHALGYGVPLLTNNNMDEHFPEIEAISEGITGWFFKEDYIPDFVCKVETIINKIKYKGFFYDNCISLIEGNYTPAKQKEKIESAILKHLEKNQRHKPS